MAAIDVEWVFFCVEQKPIYVWTWEWIHEINIFSFCVTKN